MLLITFYYEAAILEYLFDIENRDNSAYMCIVKISCFTWEKHLHVGEIFLITFFSENREKI